MNRKRPVLFDMNNMTFRPYSTATTRILILMMRVTANPLAARMGACGHPILNHVDEINRIHLVLFGME
jgi:hypothetical protein